MGLSTFDIGGCNCPACTQLFTVEGCNNLPYAGVTVSVYSASGGTLLDSDTTDGSGQVLLSWPGNTGNWWVEVTGISSRFAAYAQSIFLTCGGSHTLNLVPTTSYACWAGCVIPVARTLHISFSPAYVPGTITLTSTGGQWFSVAGILIAFPGCGVCSARQAAIQITTSVLSGNQVLNAAWYGPLPALHEPGCPGTSSPDPGGNEFNIPETSLTCPTSFQAIFTAPGTSTLFCTATTATIVE